MACEMNTELVRQRLMLGLLLAAAFLTRLGVRRTFGEEFFWANSYIDYYRIAENVASGDGFCLDKTCAFLPPLYPLFLAVPALAGKSYLLIIVPQALMGAGTALFAFLIARQIFNATTGVIACAVTAFYPYYIMHDTALQETAMVTFCMALSVWLLLQAGRLDRKMDWFLAGAALGSTALVRASIAPAIGVALIWTAVWGVQGDVWAKLQKSAVLLLAVVMMVGPWLIRTYDLTGAPVLSSQNGWALWMGNNPETCSRYPAESIDRSRDQAWLKLTPEDHLEIDRLADDEIATSNWFAHRALVFIWENPWPVLRGAVRKLEAGFSWRLNPNRDPLAEAAYAIGYLPVVLLGILGMFFERRRRETILIGMLFLAFICVTAVFWAHTSHRTYLDVYLIIFGASVLNTLQTRIAGGFSTRLWCGQVES